MKMWEVRKDGIVEHDVVYQNERYAWVRTPSCPSGRRRLKDRMVGTWEEAHAAFVKWARQEYDIAVERLEKAMAMKKPEGA